MINLVGSPHGASFSPSTRFRVTPLRVSGGVIGGEAGGNDEMTFCCTPGAIPKRLLLDVAQEKCVMESIVFGSLRFRGLSAFFVTPRFVYLHHPDGGVLLRQGETWFLEAEYASFIGALDEERILFAGGIWSPREGSFLEFSQQRASGRTLDGRLLGSVRQRRVESSETHYGVFEFNDSEQEPTTLEEWRPNTKIIGVSSHSLLAREDFTTFKVLDRGSYLARSSWEVSRSFSMDWAALEAGIFERRPVPTFHSWESVEESWELDNRPEAELPHRRYIDGDGCLGEFRHDSGTHWVFHVLDPKTGNALSSIEGEWSEASGSEHLAGIVPCGPRAFLVVAPKVCLHFSWDERE